MKINNKIVREYIFKHSEVENILKLRGIISYMHDDSVNKELIIETEENVKLSNNEKPKK